MKILLIGCLTRNKSGNVYGGAEKSLINLSNWLAENTNNKVILASVEGNIQAYPVSKKVIFKGYEINASKRLKTHLEMFRNTYAVIKQIKPDIIIGFWIHPLFYALISGAAKNIPLIYAERNDPDLDYSKISKLMRNVMLKKAKGVVFQTKGAQSYFNKKIYDKSVIIHNPVYIDETKYPIYDDGKKRIVTVGRLNRQKNQKMLIQAFKEIIKEFPGYILEIYGEGPLKKELQHDIDNSILKNKVHLMGAFPDVLDRIYGASLFVLPSLYEGMPNALLEAMCLGIPVISSDCPCGGPAEIIENGINGFLFEVNNRQNLVRTMSSVLSLNRADKLYLQKNEKLICNSHSEKTIFTKWNKYIEECMNDTENK